MQCPSDKSFRRSLTIDEEKTRQTDGESERASERGREERNEANGKFTLSAPWNYLAWHGGERKRRRELVHARECAAERREVGAYGVLTGNGDEQEEYPRIHESADREEAAAAAAAAGWRGSPGHHAPRRIADLDTWGYNSGSLLSCSSCPSAATTTTTAAAAVPAAAASARSSRRRTNAPTDLRRETRESLRNSASRLFLTTHTMSRVALAYRSFTSYSRNVHTRPRTG